MYYKVKESVGWIFVAVHVEIVYYKVKESVGWIFVAVHVEIVYYKVKKFGNSSLVSECWGFGPFFDQIWIRLNICIT